MYKKTKETKKPQRRPYFAMRLITGILVVLSYIILFACIWMTRKINLNATGWDAVFFTLTSDLSGADPKMILNIVLLCVLPMLACSAATVFLLSHLPYLLAKKISSWKEKLQEKKYQKLQRILSLIIAAVLFLSMLIFAAFRLGLVKYVLLSTDETKIYEEYYVDPSNVEITFPEKKQNLIYIFLESMENSYMSKEEGGAMTENLIPELTELAKNNLNFSHTEGVGGLQTTTGSTWTIAAMISQTSGLPLRMPDGIGTNALDQFTNVMPGLVTINSILEENGYEQALLVGSDANFGGRKKYFFQHGIEQIYDLFTARKADDLLPSQDYLYGWGMEDHYLFDYAKRILPDLANGDKPFAFTMLTVDTHFERGYPCKYCQSDHDEQYENVVSCSDRQVAEFVRWIQEQDFAEDTTIIIVGDHYTMDNQYLGGQIPQEYTRTVYNCIINPLAEATNTKNRVMTTLDMFPTTLAAIGCTIEGERLGLGTNLFSDRKTLAEELGFQYLCDEFHKRSDFYYDKFFYDKDVEGGASATDYFDRANTGSSSAGSGKKPTTDGSEPPDEGKSSNDS